MVGNLSLGEKKSTKYVPQGNFYKNVYIQKLKNLKKLLASNWNILLTLCFKALWRTKTVRPVQTVKTIKTVKNFQIIKFVAVVVYDGQVSGGVLAHHGGGQHCKD